MAARKTTLFKPTLTLTWILQRVMEVKKINKSLILSQNNGLFIIDEVILSSWKPARQVGHSFSWSEHNHMFIWTQAYEVNIIQCHSRDTNEFQTKSTHIFHFVLICKDHANLFTKSSYSSIKVFCKNSKMKKISFFFFPLSNFLPPTITVYSFSFYLIISMLEKIPITLLYVQIILNLESVHENPTDVFFPVVWASSWHGDFNEVWLIPRNSGLQKQVS